MRREWREAAISGDGSAIRALIENGGEVDSKDEYGQTALMLAAMHGRDEAVELLIAAGADLDVTAKYGLTALMLAVVNHHDPIARSLAAAGADLSPKGSGAPGFHGKTAKDLARDNGQDGLAAFLENREADASGRNHRR